MSVERIQSPYEKISTIFKIPYWIFWPLVGIILFSILQIIIYLNHETSYFITYAIGIIGIISWPIAMIYTSIEFYNVTKALIPIIWTEIQYDEWYTEQGNINFRFNQLSHHCLTIIIVIAGIYTYASLPLPFNYVSSNVVCILIFIIVIFIGSHSAYTIVRYIISLRNISLAYSPKIPFYYLPHPSIDNLHSFYLKASIIVTLGYFSLLIAVRYSPYELINAFVILWLSFLAFFPILLFFLSNYYIHTIMLNVKIDNISVINRFINDQLAITSKDRIKSNTELLNQYMEIQTKLLRMREWPVDIQGIVTFLISTTPIIIQTYKIFFSKSI